MKDESTNGKLIIAMSRALRNTHTQSEAMLRKNGITRAQFEVLEALYHKGPMTIGSLIEAVLSTSGNMTVVIRNLEQSGMVKRTKNEIDGRSYLIDLTEPGRRSISTVFKKHMALLNDALSPLTYEEKTTVTNILSKLR